MLKDLFIISAVKFEAAPTLDMFTKYGVSFDYRETGIGPVNAAKSAVRLEGLVRGKNVLCLGSAGAFSGFEAPALVTVDEVFWMPTAERMGLAKFMTDLHKPVKIPGTGHFDLPVKKVLTSTSVSLDSTVALEELPSLSDLIENMEAYSLAEDLVAVTKTFDIIFGITNAVGAEGSKDWAKNFKNIASMTADYLEKKFFS